MTNEEFQKRIFEEFDLIRKEFASVRKEFSTTNNELKNELRNEFQEGFKELKTRQDEIYDVVRAIEHSNQVGRSEQDSQNIRIAKLEGRFKKVARACSEGDIDKASNL